LIKHDPAGAGRSRTARFVATVGVALAATLGSTLLTTLPAHATAKPVVAAKPVKAAAAPVQTTRFGAAVWQTGKETYQAALARADKTYGRMDMTRVFYGGAPAAWPGNAGISGRPVAVSFKFAPANVIAGKHDAQMLTWFKTAPKDRDVDWIYYHEPEDNIAAKEFTAVQYRAAWRRLAGLAKQAKNPRLKSSLTLMCWTFEKASGRKFADYYPGSDVIDVMSYDCYNLGATKGRYDDPAIVFGPAVANAKALGKPFAIAEAGSLLVKGDNGTKRAAWLEKSANYLRAQNARYVAYFDAPVGGEFRLLDQPSQVMWKKHVTAA
jgi:hypothetical protein